MAATTTSQVLVARQPILDLSQRVFGYELLYRSSADDRASSGAQMSARVINDALLSIGLDALTDGRRAFINFDEGLLRADVSSVFPPDRLVVEVLESVAVTEEVTAICVSLRGRGYQLALDDFVPGSAAESLVPLATYVKLDVLSLSAAEMQAVTRRLVSSGVTVLAEKVETVEVFESTRAAGCSLFQGYFFCKPTTMSGRSVGDSHLGRLRLVAALNQPSVDTGLIEELLKQDGSLSYRVLRSVNSAAFGLRRQVGSIREALLLLGLDQVRKWSSIWALASMNRGSSEIVTMLVIRARCCELIGKAMGRSDQGAAFFLLGLCSLLDVLLAIPMAKAVEDMPLDDDLRAALVGEPNVARTALDTVRAYEGGQFDEAGRLARQLGLAPDELAEIYTASLAWAHTLAQGSG